MNKILKMTSLGWMCLMLVTTGYSQKIDQDRMERDIEVAENVLGTLLRQSMTKGRSSYFFSEVNGTYTQGYGVVFSVPFNEYYVYGAVADGIGISRGYTIRGDGAIVVNTDRSRGDEVAVIGRNELSDDDIEKLRTKEEKSRDSARTALKEGYIDAMKTFLADYGDLISQLKDDEKIMITNRPNGFDNALWGAYKSKRTLLSAEITKGDLGKMRQGQMTRKQLLDKIKVTNTESVAKVETDLELFSSIMNRLYSSDLSKTYYTSGNVYYEQLADYGAVYYMVVYSSNRIGDALHSMPTQNIAQISEEERDKKVKELYPAFEKDVKENLVEYGKTIRSLKPEEMLVLNVKLTKCEGCGIPSTLELTVKEKVLQDYASGKITKDSAIGSINVTKGPNQ